MGKKGKKAQNGRAKQKQKAQGSTPRSTPRSRYVQQQVLGDDWDDDAPIHFRGFAQDGPSSNVTPRSAPAKLRHQGISFVSASNSPAAEWQKPPEDIDIQIALDDTDEDDDEDEFDDADVDDSHIQTNILLAADIDTNEEAVARLDINTSADVMDLDMPNSNTMSEDALFVVDTVGDPSLAGNVQQNVKRAPSPTPSDSSEEVVIFAGRNKATVITDPVVASTATPTALPARPKPSTAFNPSPFVAPSQGWGKRQSQLDTSQRPGSGWTPAPEVPYWKKGEGKAVPRPDLAPSAQDLKALEASPPKQSKVQFAEAPGEDQVQPNTSGESIATLRSNWKNALQEKRKDKQKIDLEDDTSSKASRSSRRSKRGRKKDNRAIRQNLDSDDGDSEAAYDDYMENLRAQLDDGEMKDEEDAIFSQIKASHSSAISGPSMVVDGEERGEDEVLPKHKKLGRNIEMIEDDSEWESDDDDELNPDLGELSSNDSIDDSDVEDEIEYSERQQWQDEDDLRRRRIDRLDDERIARLLAKQEELGMGSSEILIEDGDYPYPSDDGFGDLDAARAGLSDITNYTFGRRANKHGMSRRSDKKHSYPDASAMADAVEQYGDNGFDVMDFERPSLRPTKKGRKGQPPAVLEDLSDEELRDELIEQWGNDKATKRQKKLEREELRAEGLLGSAGRKGKADLSQKYLNGMSMRHVWDELREFLQDDEAQMRAFPPMDKVDRKELHNVAQALGLNSKSQGGGKKRFPVIYKTSRTEEFSADMYHRVMQASAKGALGYRKSGKKDKRGTTAGRGGRGGRGGFGGGQGGGTAAATVRHGEVVGAGAAEISSSSFGHKMMMKMGWEKGKALGKDGEGMLVPVEQRMRVGTAGLG